MLEDGENDTSQLVKGHLLLGSRYMRVYGQYFRGIAHDLAVKCILQ